MTTQYRIYSQASNCRSYVHFTSGDYYSWSSIKEAQLFDGIEKAEAAARAIEAEIERRGYGKVKLTIAPARGGMSKTRKAAYV